MSNTKKLKKKKVVNKPKGRIVNFDLDPVNAAYFDGLTISGDGRVQGLKWGKQWPLIGKNSLIYSYKRESGKQKVLTKGPIVNEFCYINPSLPITNFQHVFAIDTNTSSIGEDGISVSAITYCCFGEKRSDSVPMCMPFILGWFEFRNLTEKPENFAWMELVKLIGRSSDFKDGSIGLVVDSDLGNHDLFNKRELPICEDFYLPERVELIYGSADAGAESLVNKLIRFSDKRVKFLMDYIKQNDNFGDCGAEEGKPYTHYRHFEPNWDDPDNRLKLAFQKA